MGPDKQPKHQAPTISSTDKSLSRNHRRVWSPTHRRTIKEESKVANPDWVDLQACSLLQYINVIANLFIMGNYFNELRWKFIRANNLLQFIHQVTIQTFFESMCGKKSAGWIDKFYKKNFWSIVFQHKYKTTLSWVQF